MSIPTLRRSVTDRLGRVVDRWVNARIPYDRLDDVSRALVSLQDQISETSRRLDGEQHRLDDLIARVDGFHDRAEWTASQVERALPQVAAQEAELQSLRERIAAPPVARPGEALEAKGLIEEIREEHAKIRVRLTGIARYEERLGRLEERAAGDATA